jgi:uncharacterized protein
VNPYLIAAISGRMLAQSAARGGYAVQVLDLFNDLDTRRYAQRSRKVAGRDGGLAGFDRAALLAAAQEISLSPTPGERAGERGRASARPAVVYGSGFEDDPDLLRELARGRQLFGNSPQTVRRVKDPHVFFPLLDELDIPHPAVRFDPPSNSDGWLVKKVGGSGGAHVFAAAENAPAAAHYYQRFAPGTSYSVAFLADTKRACTIGYNEPWSVPLGEWRYCYAGAVSRVPLLPTLTEAITHTLDQLVPALGLVGLNGLDFLVRGEEYSVIEVNPRPSGTLDLYDADCPQGLFHWHLRACSGELPQHLFASQRIRAHAVVYAPHSVRLPAGFAFPAWCSDIPEPGSEFAARMPVCMVHAEGDDHASAKRLVFERRDRIHDLIRREAA